eukprot:gene10467-14061_t
MSLRQENIENGSTFEYLITNYRWFFVVFFLMPMSLTYDMYFLIINTWTFMTHKSNPSKHASRVDKISIDIKDWIKGGSKQKLCTARPGWQAMSLRQGKYKKSYRNIDCNLHDILKVDTEKCTCTVEPMCTMGQITHTLLPLGWSLPVLPELDDLTVGGLVAGVGIETSSHKYGLFQHVCVAFELVLADGSIVTCTKESNPDLFYSVPWSHGTLGFLVSVEIQIIRCKPYVDLTYIPYHNKAAAIDRFIKESREANFDFVECLAYSPEEYVVMLGRQTDNRNAATYNPIGLWYKEWFYIHTQKYLTLSSKQNAKTEFREIIPLRHYYHRHTKSLFWELSDVIPFGNNIIFRVLFGWMMPPKPSLLKLTQTEALRKLYELHHVVQDMLVPIVDLSEALSVFDKEVYIYPLWLCPFKIFHNGTENDETSAGKKGKKRKSKSNLLENERGFIHPLPSDEMFVDIGAYGNPQTKNFKARDTCRRLEDYVRSVNGYQMMYADSYMTQEEFRSMFDHTLYDKLRDEYPLCKLAFPEESASYLIKVVLVFNLRRRLNTL